MNNSKWFTGPTICTTNPAAGFQYVNRPVRNLATLSSGHPQSVQRTNYSTVSSGELLTPEDSYRYSRDSYCPVANVCEELYSQTYGSQSRPLGESSNRYPATYQEFCNDLNCPNDECDER